MGGGQKRGRTQRRHFKQSRENVWKYNNKGRPEDASQDDPGTNSDPNANPSFNLSWQPFATQNAAFEEYYKEQGIVPVEEWDEFISVLRKPLPAAFRINASGQFFQDIREQLENDFVKSLEADVTNEYEEEAIRPLPWYPGNLAWHLNYSRMQLRKNQTLERFHEFLKQENEIGNITRQEAVSMVPPLFLDVLPEHHILDMCAAPGSKTFQLLEMMHQSTEIGLLPSGMVIANDVDVQRCNLLIHQTKRMCSANLIVTNHEAQHFPSCHLLNNCSEVSNDIAVSGELTSDHTSHARIDEPMNSKLLFDRVLCDVPCSGDGTLRKAPDIWRKWHSGNGNGLHNLQVLIAMRGLALLKVGGRMVYSTCSMNPVENEAVVSEILSRCGQSIELLDVSCELPSLKRRPGLKKWKVRDKGFWLSSYSDVPHNRKSTILPSMFPSGRTSTINRVSADSARVVKHEAENDMKQEANTVCPDPKNGSTTLDYKDECSTNTFASIDSKESTSQRSEVPDLSVQDANNTDDAEVTSLPLERCIRILPHDQNSGAFFIAVFQKISPLQVVPDKRHNNSSRLNATKNKTLTVMNENDASKHEEEKIQENVQIHCLELANSRSNPLGDLLTETEVVAVNSNGTSSSNNGIEDTEKITAMEDGQEGEKATKGKSQTQSRWRGIDPVLFFEDSAAIKSIIDFYGIQSSFPLNHHLVSRNEDASHVKRIYYISKSVEDILNLNFRVGQRLKIASLGLKMFERQSSKDCSSPCAFRISSEGLPLLLPHIAKQILYASLTDLQHLLQYRNIKFAEFVDTDFREQASKLLNGCCIVVLNEGAEVVRSYTIAIVCWRGKSSLSVMVSEMDGREMLERLRVRFGAGRTTVVEDEAPLGDAGLRADHGDYESKIDAEEMEEDV